MGGRVSGCSGRMERKEVSQVITDDKYVEIVQRTRAIVTKALERGTYLLAEREMLSAPIVASVFAALVEEERAVTSPIDGPALVGFVVDDEESE
jgi:hypothetical protein